MNKVSRLGIFLAIVAAALYAIHSLISKILLDYMPPTHMTGFLYIGAGTRYCNYKKALKLPPIIRQYETMIGGFLYFSEYMFL